LDGPAGRGANINDLLTIAIELLFALIFLRALVTYVRSRDPLSRDVMLVFSILAVVFVLEVAERVGLEIPSAVSRITAVLILLQPYLTLRLARQLGPVHRWVLPAALIAWFLTAAPFLAIQPPVPTAITLAAVAVFVVTEFAAAVYLAREAKQRVGSARVRLAIAASATAAFAIAIFAAGASSAASAGGTETGPSLTAIIALLAAIGYAVAFIPPAWLRRLWQANAVFSFSNDLMRIAPDASIAELWARFAAAARRIAGSEGAVVVAGPRGAEATELARSGDPPEGLTVAGDLGGLLASDSEVERTIPAPGGGRGLVTTLPLPDSGDERVVVVLFARYRALFASDDRDVIRALATRTALLAERRAVLADQERLTAELAVTVKALEAASQAKSDFLASMSHELRTPLTAIIGFSELMRKEPGDDAVVSVPREWVEHIHRSGNHLLGLINDVLDLTKVEAGRLELQHEPIDLSAAIAESIAGLRPLADRKSLVVTSDVERTFVVADRGRLRQILYNLLSNAIKFTPEGGHIEVVARSTPAGTTIAVVDSGIGIAPEDQQHVFDEFRQVGDTAGREAGTGLGLALSRRLAEAHGGTIELSSEIGVGSRFTVTLPEVAEHTVTPLEPSPPSTPAPSEVGSRAIVLVIEDDPGAVRLLRTYLEGDGYEVRMAADGESGLAEAAANPPGAIILDVLLPGIDGWEVLRRLKLDERLRNIPVLMVTVVDERELGLALGAVDYIVKPVDRQGLLDRLARYTFTTKVKEQAIRILAVDDDPAALDLISTELGKDGFVVVTAEDGRRALEVARSQPFELVICDLLMPDVDGFAVVAALKEDPVTRDIPIVILTAHDLSEADKDRLNGNILGIVRKGPTAEAGLRTWLTRAVGPTLAGSNGAQAV
jgi:signal transduction histidine kinase/CheY-like chemotaxis protein